ncbi:MAG: hypothetical protein WAW37_01965 [Syntrophobacteraceae bacterium]
MSDTDKIAAVEKYLKEEFDAAAIESGLHAGRKARIFKIKSADRSATAIVENEFLEKHSAEAIPGILRTYLLAEHLKECSFPIVVTTGGLTD